LQRELKRLLVAKPEHRRSDVIPLADHVPVTYSRLRRLVLHDEVNRTLFAEYAAHCGSERGHEEIGWVLLGLRNADEAIAMATLPAGTERDAGNSHVLSTRRPRRSPAGLSGKATSD